MFEAKFGNDTFQLSNTVAHLPAKFTCSKSTIETLEKGVKYVQVNNENTRTTSMTSSWCLYH